MPLPIGQFLIKDDYNYGAVNNICGNKKIFSFTFLLYSVFRITFYVKEDLERPSSYHTSLKCISSVVFF